MYLSLSTYFHWAIKWFSFPTLLMSCKVDILFSSTVFIRMCNVSSLHCKMQRKMFETQRTSEVTWRHIITYLEIQYSNSTISQRILDLAKIIWTSDLSVYTIPLSHDIVLVKLLHKTYHMLYKYAHSRIHNVDRGEVILGNVPQRVVPENISFVYIYY